MFKRLLQVSSIYKENTPSSTIVDHSALTTQSYHRGRGRGSNRGGRGGGRNSSRFCDFCNKPGHTREVCWKLHGKPTMVNIAQSGNPNTADSSTQVISKAEYAEFLQLKGAKTTISPDISHTALASQSNSVWVLDSGATDHISGPTDKGDDWYGT
ncbi:PREDICTED: uncharacterized protein LOC109182576 [Ipomoea nil]|uniref:uncharacterized protein LOC109182576 n=1 Tax=Ipomoea nil TaxID=35883 RepID=UPI000901A197|nr:PREDICTED: uncharacterized protein LOC109182576 [Ipomoea nil]